MCSIQKGAVFLYKIAIFWGFGDEKCLSAIGTRKLCAMPMKASFLVPRTFWFFLVTKRTVLPIFKINKRRDSSASVGMTRLGLRDFFFGVF